MNDRDRLVAIIALIDEVDRWLHQMGHDQKMSVGPVLSDVNDLQEEVVERGHNYGILEKSEDVYDLRADATDFDVYVGFDGEWPYGDLEWAHAALSLKAIERIEEKDDDHEPEEWLDDDPLTQCDLIEKHVKAFTGAVYADDSHRAQTEAADILNRLLMTLDIMERGDDE